MSITRYAFIMGSLEAINSPATTEHVIALHARALQEWSEDSRACPTANLFDLTEPMPGSTPFNSFGPNDELHVWNYPTLAVGYDAFRAILTGSEYGAVVDLLKSSTSSADEIIAAWNETNWGHCDPTLVTFARHNLPALNTLPVNIGEAVAPTPVPVNSHPAPIGDDTMHTATYTHGGEYAVRGSRKMPLSSPDEAATFRAANPEATAVSLTDAQLDSLQTVAWGQL